MQQRVPTIVSSGPVRGQTPGVSGGDRRAAREHVLVRDGVIRQCPQRPSRPVETQGDVAGAP